MTILYLVKIINEKMSIIEMKRCSSAAHVSKRAHDGSAGYDVWSAEKVNLKLWGREFVLIDLKVAVPEGFYGRVVGCSGIAKKYGITVHNGTIDSDYRGIVGVILFNFFNEEYDIERGDRIAQVIIERYYTPKFVEVSDFTKEKTERGEGGFSSTGL